MVDWLEFRPSEIIERLTAGGVDFVLVGGYAAVLHGSPRITQDLDICYATSPENLEALGSILIDLEARLAGVEEEVPFVPDTRTLSQVTLLTLETNLGKLDLLARPEGAPSYARLRNRATKVKIDGVSVRIAAIDDLIGMKRVAGRPKDVADVVELEAIKRLRRAKRND